MQATSSCRICGAVANFSFRREGWSYARCDGCAALMKILTREAYVDLSPSYDPGPEVSAASSALLRSYLDVDTKLELLKKLLPDAPNARRFLDIGCGAGGYLLAAQELGLSAVGVEPSQSHSRIARQLGLRVVDGYFSAEQFEAEPFDVVLLSHVIEHILEPRSFLQECLRVLSPGGILCVITPNSDSLLARFSGRNWVMLKPIDHVTMFAAKSFEDQAISGLGLYRLEQSEYVWEPLVSLAAAGRDAIKPALRMIKSRGELGAETKPQTNRQSAVTWSRKLSMVRTITTVLGLPLHLAARASGREATLVARFRRT